MAAGALLPQDLFQLLYTSSEFKVIFDLFEVAVALKSDLKDEMKPVYSVWSYSLL